MKQLIRTFALATAVGSALVSQAAVTPTDGLTANNWQGTPTYLNYNTTPLNNGTGGAFVAEQNFGTGLSLMNSFALPTGGFLENIQLLLGGPATTYSLTLYNLDPGYVQSASTIDPGTLTVAYSTTGIAFAGTAGAAVTRLDFTGVDQVALAAGNYGLAITTTAATTLQWFRGGADTFAGDMLYRHNGTVYEPINASGPPYRHAAFAVTVSPVPEPTTAALFGMAALIGTFVVRRRIA